jgi:chromosome segregation ATPase
MTKAQQTYERINALVDGGMQKADAFKQLAEEYGQPVDSIRGAYYTHTRKQAGESGGTRRPRKRETTPQDAVEQAVATLRRAVDNIDAEIEAAKTRAEEAQAEYQALKQSASQRKKEIETKITALEA